jgi:hypothetical protein
MSRILQFLRQTTQHPTMELLPPHVIDLSPDGHIGPHVDSIKFSGGMISGLSLLSSRMMRLTPCSLTDTIANDQDMLRIELPCLDLLEGAQGYDPTLIHFHQHQQQQNGATEDKLTSSSSSTESDARTDVKVNSEINSSSSRSTVVVEMELPPRSLYVLTGSLRYLYTHAVISPTPLPQRRISVMFRDQQV